MRKVVGYLLKALALVLAAISINFLLVQLMPGDPLVHILGEQEFFLLDTRYPDLLEEARLQYGLDGSLAGQYARFLKNTVTLQFGKSFTSGQSAVGAVMYRMRWTLMLALTSIILSTIVGGTLGVVAGYYKGGKVDGALTLLFLFLETIPANCLALVALLFFSFKLRWFPLGGMASGGLTGFAEVLNIMYHMALPVMVLSLFRTSSNFLLVKSLVSQIREDEYMITATAKGLPKRVLLGKHILRSVLVPYVTVLCMQFGFVFSGSMLIEVVFSWRGMGTFVYNAVMSRDYPTVQLSFLLSSVCVIFFHFVADVLAWKLDPRIKDGLQNEA
jgi:peptide/nickel transport system permease protein